MESKFFSNNRKKLISALGDGSPIVIVAHGSMQMSRDTEFSFEQDRNFYYLTGIDEPDWILVIDADGEYLIEPELSEVEQIFNGKHDRINITNLSGVDEITSQKDGWVRLKKFKQIRSTQAPEVRVGSVFTNPARRVFFDRLGVQVEDITEQILTMRTIKQPAEVDQIKRAVELTGQAFAQAKEKLNALSLEAQLEAVFGSHFVANDSKHAYNPIVATDANACTLHYVANKDRLDDKALVLVDIGAEVNNYAADISRTWELSSATKRHQEVVRAVKIAFDEIIKLIKPGLAFKEYQVRVDEIMIDALGKLGLKNDEEHLRKYLPHSPSHGLGLDVHDPIVGYLSMEKDMVITLEPGIYIPDEGIGVRHEDDLLITSSGVENLSEGIE